MKTLRVVSATRIAQGYSLVIVANVESLPPAQRDPRRYRFNYSEPTLMDTLVTTQCAARQEFDERSSAVFPRDLCPPTRTFNRDIGTHCTLWKIDCRRDISVLVNLQIDGAEVSFDRVRDKRKAAPARHY